MRLRHAIRAPLAACAIVFGLGGCNVSVGLVVPAGDGGLPDGVTAGDGGLPDGVTVGDGAVPDHAMPDMARPDLATDCPMPINPALRLFTIVARNDTKVDRYVVANSCINDTSCNRFNMINGACMTYGVARGGAALDLLMNFRTVCEGPGLPSNDPGGLHRVAPGATYTVGYWTGSSLRTCTRPVDCATQGWPQGGIVNVVEGVRQEVVPGLYTITVPVENTVPNDCTSTGNDNFGCSGNNQLNRPIVMPICKSSSTASVQFTVPMAGDATVIVPITM